MISPASAPPALEALKHRLRQALEAFPEIRLAILFGSAVEGRLKPDSDLDIAVAAECELPVEDRLVIQDRLASTAGREIDLLDLQAVSGAILQQALSRSQLLIIKDHTLYGNLISRMLFNQADMMPLTRRILDERRRRFLQ
jgi:predicted nucleotidyltransferase